MDVKIGSNEHMENCVTKIGSIIENLDRFSGIENLTLLSDFVGVLKTISAKSGDCVISKACSSTMPNPAKWPFLRFKNAAKFYENEISSVIYTMSSDDGGGGGADAIVIEVSE